MSSALKFSIYRRARFSDLRLQLAALISFFRRLFTKQRRSGAIGENPGTCMRIKNQIVIVAIALLLCSCSPPAGPTAQTGDFDLVAASVTYRPNPVHVGDKVVLDQVVRNNGTNTVRGGTYYVDLYLDGRVVSFDRATPDILPGGSVPYSMAAGYFTWQPTNAGRFHYRLVVDERNTVRARIETNNVLQGDIDVLP